MISFSVKDEASSEMWLPKPSVTERDALEHALERPAAERALRCSLERSLESVVGVPEGVFGRTADGMMARYVSATAGAEQERLVERVDCTEADYRYLIVGQYMQCSERC